MISPKTVLKGKFIALRAHVRKEERSQINNINSYLRKLGIKKTKVNPNQAEQRK